MLKLPKRRLAIIMVANLLIWFSYLHIRCEASRSRYTTPSSSDLQPYLCSERSPVGLAYYPSTRVDSPPPVIDRYKWLANNLETWWTNQTDGFLHPNLIFSPFPDDEKEGTFSSLSSALGIFAVSRIQKGERLLFLPFAALHGPYSHLLRDWFILVLLPRRHLEREKEDMKQQFRQSTESSCSTTEHVVADYKEFREREPSATVCGPICDLIIHFNNLDLVHIGCTSIIMTGEGFNVHASEEIQEGEELFHGRVLP